MNKLQGMGNNSIEIDPLDEQQLRLATKKELISSWDKMGHYYKHGSQRQRYAYKGCLHLIASEIRRRRYENIMRVH